MAAPAGHADADTRGTGVPASGLAAVGSELVPPGTLLDSVLQSIVTPGAGPGLVATINVSLLALLVTLALLVVTGDADVHTAIMGVLALGLLGSLNYLVGVLHQVEHGAADAKTAAAAVAGAVRPLGPLVETAAQAANAAQETSRDGTTRQRPCGVPSAAAVDGSERSSSDVPSRADTPLPRLEEASSLDHDGAASHATSDDCARAPAAPRSGGGARRRHA